MMSDSDSAQRQHPSNPTQESDRSASSNMLPDPYRPVSVGNWMIRMFLASIPFVNIVILCIWAFSENTKRSKSNWAKATLIYTLISLIIWLPMLFMFSLSRTSFSQHKESAQFNVCKHNQIMIQSAKDQWAIETDQSAYAVVSEPDIAPFLPRGGLPLCPTSGTYSFKRIGVPVRCSHHGHLIGNR